MELVIWLIGAALSCVALYGIIRIAVKHGIQDTGRRGWERPPDSLPPFNATDTQ